MTRAEEVTDLPPADRVMGGEEQEEFLFMIYPIFSSILSLLIFSPSFVLANRLLCIRDQIILLRLKPKILQGGSKPGGDGKMKLNLNLKVLRYQSILHIVQNTRVSILSGYRHQ